MSKVKDKTPARNTCRANVQIIHYVLLEAVPGAPGEGGLRIRHVGEGMPERPVADGRGRGERARGAGSARAGNSTEKRL